MPVIKSALILTLLSRCTRFRTPAWQLQQFQRQVLNAFQKKTPPAIRSILLYLLVILHSARSHCWYTRRKSSPAGLSARQQCPPSAAAPGGASPAVHPLRLWVRPLWPSGAPGAGPWQKPAAAAPPGTAHLYTTLLWGNSSHQKRPGKIQRKSLKGSNWFASPPGRAFALIAGNKV